MFDLLFRQQLITRWSLMSSTREDNDLLHAARVAMLSGFLAYKLDMENYDYVAVCGLYHDASEIITGDIPSPIKHLTRELTDIHAKVDKIARENLVSRSGASEYFSKYLIDIPEDVVRVVKCADTLDAYLFALSEVSKGNIDFSASKDKLAEKLRMSYSNMPAIQEIIDDYTESLSHGFDSSAFMNRRV